MLGLDPAVVAQCLTIEPSRHLVKLALRHMHPDLAAKVEAEVDKLVTTRFS